MVSFWNRNKEKIKTFLICSVLFIGFLSIIALLCGAVMKLFGFEYESVGSVILFFIISTIISYPFGLIAGALPKALLYCEKIQRKTAVIIYVLLDTFATYIGLRVVDYFMESVSAAKVSVLVVSFALSLFGIEDIDKKTDN